MPGKKKEQRCATKEDQEEEFRNTKNLFNRKKSLQFDDLILTNSSQQPEIKY